MNLNNIELLDCTLRDGGLGLEDCFKMNSDVKLFDKCFLSSTIKSLVSSNIDIIEIGSLEPRDDNRIEMAIFNSIDSLSSYVPSLQTNTKFAGLFRGPDFDIKSIPDWDPSKCEIVRVILRYSELRKSMDFCSELVKKGYKVFVQPMVTLRYSNQELDYLIDKCNVSNISALYFVDSYGCMLEKDVDNLFNKFHSGLNSNIKIGFHAHNNMNLAFSNVLHFMEMSNERRIIIDSCCTGMGQGSGNLQTELLISFLITHYDVRYKIGPILDVCEDIENNWNQSLWGYSVLRMISAINGTAYKYSGYFKNIAHLPYSTIFDIYKNMPYDLKQRYTIENAVTVLKERGLCD